MSRHKIWSWGHSGSFRLVIKKLSLLYRVVASLRFTFDQDFAVNRWGHTEQRIEAVSDSLSLSTVRHGYNPNLGKILAINTRVAFLTFAVRLWTLACRLKHLIYRGGRCASVRTNARWMSSAIHSPLKPWVVDRFSLLPTLGQGLQFQQPIDLISLLGPVSRRSSWVVRGEGRHWCVEC
jgi:hypothetical protein